MKFRVQSFAAVRNRIKALGGKLEWAGEERNYFFDTEAKSLRARKMTLRLRERENGPAALTLKITPARNHGKYKVMHEYEIGVTSVAATARMLELLGFIKWFQYNKHREHWRFDKLTAGRGAHVELDAVRQTRDKLVHDLKFVEIEASKKNIDALAKQLCLDWKTSTTKGYLTILGAR